MKLQINCPRCGSGNVSMAENLEGVTPMYQCKDCGHKQRLFPQFESDKTDLEED